MRNECLYLLLSTSFEAPVCFCPAYKQTSVECSLFAFSLSQNRKRSVCFGIESLPRSRREIMFGRYPRFLLSSYFSATPSRNVHLSCVSLSRSALCVAKPACLYWWTGGLIRTTARKALASSPYNLCRASATHGCSANRCTCVKHGGSPAAHCKSHFRHLDSNLRSP
jgi:hypothetical protein